MTGVQTCALPIYNCYTVSVSVSGQTLSWALNSTNKNFASLATVARIEIYDSTDGVHATLLATQAPAARGSCKVGSLASGVHRLYVRMVGKNSILNRMSPGIPYSN